VARLAHTHVCLHTRLPTHTFASLPIPALSLFFSIEKASMLQHVFLMLCKVLQISHVGLPKKCPKIHIIELLLFGYANGYML
jgi:hypothetical protein